MAQRVADWGESVNVYILKTFQNIFLTFNRVAMVCCAFLQGFIDLTKRHLPVHVKAISVVEKTIAAGEVWDVSVRGSVWGLDDMEELYVTVNVCRLIIEPGASLIVRGNVFSLLCQEIMAHENTRRPDQAGVSEIQLGTVARFNFCDVIRLVLGTNGASVIVYTPSRSRF